MSLTQGDLRKHLRKHLVSDARPPALRPLAARVRSIWRFSRLASDLEMRSLFLISHSALPRQLSWPAEHAPCWLTLTPELSGWIKTGSSQYLTRKQGRSSRSTSTERMRVISRSLESLS